MNNTGNGKPVFYLFVINAVTAEEADTGFTDLISATPYNLLQYLMSNRFGEKQTILRAVFGTAPMA